MAATMIRRPERASGIPEVLRQPKLLNGKPRILDRGGGFQAQLKSRSDECLSRDARFRSGRSPVTGAETGQLRLHFGHEIW
jgi:hypothetical protein